MSRIKETAQHGVLRPSGFAVLDKRGAWDANAAQHNQHRRGILERGDRSNRWLR